MYRLLITIAILCCFLFCGHSCRSKEQKYFASSVQLSSDTMNCAINVRDLQWVKPAIESSHSILEQDKNLLDRDFSSILADKRADFIGYIGNDYHKMNISFHTIKKESNTTYSISGSSKVKTNVCAFLGSAQILDVRELNEYEYGVDQFMKDKIKKQGICIARYNLEEEKEQKGSGTFSGILLFHWYIDNNNQLNYDDISDDSDDYSNNQFAGIWRSHSTGKEKKCAWGQFRIPDSGDLDIGAAEFSANPIYVDNGWNRNDYEKSGITEYSYVQRDLIKDSISQYSSYKIVSKDSGTYFCILINGIEYRLSDILDYGDFDLKVYKNDNSTILLIGLIDFYASTHFVYLFRDNNLMRLGQIDVDQPSDVEEYGMREISFKLYNEGDKIFVESYLDDVFQNKNELLIKNK